MLFIIKLIIIKLIIINFLKKCINKKKDNYNAELTTRK